MYVSELGQLHSRTRGPLIVYLGASVPNLVRYPKYARVLLWFLLEIAIVGERGAALFSSSRGDSDLHHDQHVGLGLLGLPVGLRLWFRG